MGLDPGRSGRLLRLTLMTGLGLVVASCNAAVGGGLVALAGGAGYLAAQCYDRVRVRVRDPHTGLTTCSPDVWVSEGGGSERQLRPCYSAALTEGKWTLSARLEGYAPATTELVIPEHEGDCPHYTHTVELTLRRPGEPSTVPVATRNSSANEAPSKAGASSAGASDIESPPARVVPPPIPGGSATPVVPTRSFDPVPTPQPAPQPAPAPAPAPSPAPTPAPSPAPAPAPSPAPAPAPSPAPAPAPSPAPAPAPQPAPAPPPTG